MIGLIELLEVIELLSITSIKLRGLLMWNKTLVEAELYEASPPNDQTRTVKIELLQTKTIPVLPQ